MIGPNILMLGNQTGNRLFHLDQPNRKILALKINRAELLIGGISMISNEQDQRIRR